MKKRVGSIFLSEDGGLEFRLDLGVGALEEVDRQVTPPGDDVIVDAPSSLTTYPSVFVAEGGKVFVGRDDEDGERLSADPLLSVPAWWPREVETAARVCQLSSGMAVLLRPLCLHCLGSGVDPLVPEGFEGPPCGVCHGTGNYVYTRGIQGNVTPFPANSGVSTEGPSEPPETPEKDG